MRPAYRIEIGRAAAEELGRLPRADQRRVASRIDGLERDPRPAGIKQLEKNIYRLRSGSYRIIYQVEDDIVLVLILKVGHRKDVYRALRRTLEERRDSR